VPGQWICKVCSMIYDPAAGDPDSGIAAGTPFEAIPDDWSCPICGTRKANFIPYREPELLAA
jgi:rubredoxin